MKKKINKIFNGVKKEKNKQTAEMVKDELKQAYDKLAETITWAQKKYNKLDNKTKKQITAGLLGATALIAGAIGAKKIIKKKK
jgi:arginine utilization protein RocB